MMVEKEEKKETVEVEGLPPKTCEGPVFHSPSGDKIREFFKWNPDMTELVKIGEENIQEAMDERAKGCTIQEQFARLIRGDSSVLQEGEGLYADVYDYPETRGQALKKGEEQLEALKKIKEKEAAEKDPNALKIKALEEELAKYKKAQEGDNK